MNQVIKKIGIYSFICLISFLILFLFSTSTSSLYGNYFEDDSAIFVLMGKVIKEGMSPYKDVFDHKGPILFFIQALGQLISEGRCGIFFVQFILLSFTNILFFKIANKFCSTSKSIITLLIGMCFFALFMEEGNLSEELSLPFIASCLYIAIIWIKSENLFNKKIYLYSFLFGINFSIIAFIRLNNAAPICGMLLGITLIFIFKKEYTKLLKCILSFLLGSFIITIPIILYFLKENALFEMLDATFLFNFKYMNIDLYEEYGIAQKLRCSMHIIILAAIGIPLIRKEKDITLLLTSTSIITYILLFFGEGFSHYYVITVPLVIIFIAILFNYLEKGSFEKTEKIFVYLIILFVCLIYMCVRIINTANYLVNKNQVTIQNIETLVNQVSEEEKKDIFVYKTYLAAPVYLYGNFMPNYKYTFHQAHLTKVDSNLENQIYQHIKNNNIKWIICNDLSDKQNLTETDQYILNNYTLYDFIEISLQDFDTLQNEKLFLYKCNSDIK